MQLRYGLNPEQSANASIDEPDSPIKLLAGQPSYINLLDALNAWQLASEAARALSRPVATSFKHVSPAGAAIAGELDAVMEATWAVRGEDLSEVARAYVRARDCDPKSSFGDFVAVSHPVDDSLATVLTSVVSDGIVAPGFEPGVVERLAAKKRGSYLVLEADPTAEVAVWERREVCGVRLNQERARTPITVEALRGGSPEVLPAQPAEDLVLAMITARYTQSNSMAYAKSGMVLGVGAGQQSRVDCTKLAGAKVDTWWLRRHATVQALAFRRGIGRQERINWRVRFIEGDMTPAERDLFLAAVDGDAPSLTHEERTSWLGELHSVVLASDGYIPFRDNIDHAARHGVRFLAHPGGSTRSSEVEAAAAEHGVTIVSTGTRLFHH